MTVDDMTLTDIRADIAAVKDDLARCATKDDLERYATKEDLERFATKEDLERFATKEDLERFATKDDLDDRTRDILKTVKMQFDALRMEMRAGFEVMNAQFAAFRADVPRQIEAASEDTREWIRSLDDKYRNLPDRVSRLERTVYGDEG